MTEVGRYTGEPIKSLYGRLSEQTGAAFDQEWFKGFVESYRCRKCKVDLTLENFGDLGPNHGIFCKNCYV